MTRGSQLPDLTETEETILWGRLGSWRSLIAMLGGAASLAAAASLALAPMAGAYTRGFSVVDLSGSSLRLVNAGCEQGDCLRPAFPPFDSRPSDGARVEPGLSHGYQAIYYFLGINDTFARYDVLDPGGTSVGSFQVFMNVDGYGGTSSRCALGSLGSKFRCDAGADTITFLDPPGTVHDIPAGQGQAQGAVLNHLCAGATAARCELTPTSQIPVDSPSHEVGSALVNNTDQTQDTTISTSDTVGNSNSVGVKVSVETGLTLFGQELKTKIEGSYGHTWTSSHEFSQSVSVHCPAHHRCALFATQPMWRTTGDFTLTMGNTTWHLHNVSFDTPDTTGSGAYEVDSTPLTHAEQATLPATFHVETPLTSRYTVPARVANRPPADARLRISITGPSTDDTGRAEAARAADTQTVRIELTALQPAHRLVYPVDDVDVRAWVDGRGARRWTVARLPFYQARTLLLRFAAPASARDQVCVTVQATAPHAIGARVRGCRAGP